MRSSSSSSSSSSVLSSSTSPLPLLFGEVVVPVLNDGDFDFVDDVAFGDSPVFVGDAGKIDLASVIKSFFFLALAFALSFWLSFFAFWYIRVATSRRAFVKTNSECQHANRQGKFRRIGEEKVRKVLATNIRYHSE